MLESIPTMSVGNERMNGEPFEPFVVRYQTPSQETIDEDRNGTIEEMKGQGIEVSNENQPDYPVFLDLDEELPLKRIDL